MSDGSAHFMARVARTGERKGVRDFPDRPVGTNLRSNGAVEVDDLAAAVQLCMAR